MQQSVFCLLNSLSRPPLPSHPNGDPCPRHFEVRLYFRCPCNNEFLCELVALPIQPNATQAASQAQPSARIENAKMILGGSSCSLTQPHTMRLCALPVMAGSGVMAMDVGDTRKLTVGCLRAWLIMSLTRSCFCGLCCHFHCLTSHPSLVDPQAPAFLHAVLQMHYILSFISYIAACDRQ